ncbi:hypothetical protein [Sphingomonas tagetis]|nr:hypothetical protein [Sphingomonas tagetis]
MADRASASIRLGGALRHSRTPELCRIITAEGLSTEWDGAPFEIDEIPADRPLELMADQVRGGTFEELEAFCVENGLPFSRSCDPYVGGWDGERLVFDGVGDPRSYRITSNDNVVMTFAELCDLGTMEAIASHFAAAEIVIPPLSFVGGEADHG